MRCSHNVSSISVCLAMKPVPWEDLPGTKCLVPAAWQDSEEQQDWGCSRSECWTAAGWGSTIIRWGSARQKTHHDAQLRVTPPCSTHHPYSLKQHPWLYFPTNSDTQHGQQQQPIQLCILSLDNCTFNIPSYADWCDFCLLKEMHSYCLLEPCSCNV